MAALPLQARARRRAGAVACAVLLVGPAAAAPAGEPDAAAVLAGQPPEVVRALQQRRLVLAADGDGEAQAVRALVVFRQPVDRVFLLLSQFARQREYRRELDSVETIERFEDGTLEEYRMRVLLLGLRYRLRSRVDPAARRISWETDPGFHNDLKRVAGSWQLYALQDGETLGVMATRVEVWAGMPSFLQDYVTRKNLPNTLEHCRRWVDSGGRSDD